MALLIIVQKLLRCSVFPDVSDSSYYSEDVIKRKFAFNLFLFQFVVFHTDCTNSLLEYYNL